MGVVEPEREVVRRVLPYAVPALAFAVLVGAALGGWDAGWSAGIAVAIVALNAAAHGLSLAWAARISPAVLVGVALGGFIVRLGTIVVVIALLNTLSWFSTVAFVATVVPATMVLLLFEARLLSGRMQADLWTFRPGPREVHR